MSEQAFLSYSRSELDSLSEVDDEKEAMARIHRFKGQIDMLAYTKIISSKTAETLYDELQVARTQAEKNIKANK